MKELDFNNPKTQKHMAEAKAVGLELLGAGRDANYRTYKRIECGHVAEYHIGGVSKNSFNCQVCQQEKLNKEANAVGLEFIGMGRNRHYRTYKRTECGHVAEYTTGNVRKDNIKCNECLQLKLTKEAKAVGLEVVGAGRDANYRTYKRIECGHVAEYAISAVRNNSFKCNECLQMKLHKEAKAVGLELLGSGRTTNYRTYKRIECGHVAEYVISMVRKNEFKCNECLQIKLNKEAKDAGLELIGPGKTAFYRTYKRIDCGHVSEYTTGGVRKNEFKCNECFQLRLRKEAKAVGLELIGAGRNTDYRTYKRIECGHVAEYTTGLVRNNNYRCNECLQLKLNKEAKSVGLELIGAGRNTNYRTYKGIECGHVAEYLLGHVRINSFNCEQCEETSRSQPSNIYLLEIESNGNKWLKLGYAKMVDNRIKQYGLPKEATVSILKTIPFETGKIAHEKEVVIHAKHKTKKLSKAKAKKLGMLENGHNECYPLKFVDVLLSELASVEAANDM